MSGVDNRAGLSGRQVKFLDDYAWDERTMESLLKDYQITPAELAQWREQEAFEKGLEEVDKMHAFVRNCDQRKGAAEYVRRARLGGAGELRMLGKAQAAALRNLARWAREDDRKLFGAVRRVNGVHPFPGRAMHVVVVNPIHPRFAHEAPELLERLEALQRRAEAARKALPAPGTGSAPSTPDEMH